MDRFKRLKAVVLRAGELPESERSAYLDEACKGDPELRREVESLLAHAGKAPTIMRTRAVVPPRGAAPDDETRTSSATPPAAHRIGGYRILRKLGEGGMGVVYEARQEHPSRTVALKVVRRDSAADDSALKRFKFEVQILGRLNHPGIAQVYDAGTSADGMPYVVMEYVPGLQPLEYAEKRKLDLRGRLELMAQVCDAIHYAHQQGVIHRDLKPANILVVDARESQPQAKILDFGVARSVPSALQPTFLHTQTGQLVGTLAYMSPEQVLGRPDDLDARSDVYQLGVILYELLTGRRPYIVDGLPVPEAARVIAEEEPPRLGATDTRWRGDVETIVGKALEKDRERRYASAAQLGEDIRRFLRGDPITARPPSAVHRIRLFRRRHQVLSQLAFLAVFAALLSLIVPRVRDWMPGDHREETSLAVLFFENLGTSKDDDYFAAGLTEDLITKVSQIHQLKVVSRTAVERYRGRVVDPQVMRRDLGIGYYLEGSLRKEGDDLRVTAQLIDAGSGFHVWSRTFDGALDQIFAIQDTITTGVAEALGVRIEPEEIPLVARRWTENAEAYAYYLTGREMALARRFYSPDWSVEPQVWFEKALQLDPDYAPALAGIAYSLTASWASQIRAPGQLERAAELAQRAKEIDPMLWDAWLAAGCVPYERRGVDRRDREKALERFKSLTEAAPEYGAGYYYLGLAYQATGRVDAAIESYKRALELTDRTYMFRDLIGAYAALGRFSDAQAAIDATLLRHPDDPDVLLAQAHLLRSRGRLQDAIEAARSAVERHPEYYHARLYLAQYLAKVGRPAEADSVFQWALQQWPEMAEIWQDAAQVSSLGGDLETAELRLRKAIELETYHQGAWSDLWRVLEKRGDFEEEERTLQKRIQLWPETWQFRADLAWLYERLGRLQQAEEVFREAARELPDVHWALQRLAWFYVRQNRYDEAEDAMGRYADRWPDDPEVLLELSKLCNRMGRYDASETWARKALERDPGSRDAHGQIGWQCSNQGRYEEAIEWFRKAIAIAPPEVSAYRGLSRTLRNLGRVDEAVRTMEDFVDLQPTSADGWLALGNFQNQAGNAYQAVASYERALELDPDRALTMSNLASIYGQLGRPEKQIELNLRAAELDSTSADPWMGVAYTAFYVLGDDERAEAAARKALDLATVPNDRAQMLSVLGAIHSSRGEVDEAQGDFARAREEIDAELQKRPGDLDLKMSAASIYAQSGDCGRARELVADVGAVANRAPVRLYNAACVMAMCEDKDAAFVYLRMAVDAGFLNKESLLADSDLKTLRDDPRFEELLASIR